MRFGSCIALCLRLGTEHLKKKCSGRGHHVTVRWNDPHGGKWRIKVVWSREMASLLVTGSNQSVFQKLQNVIAVNRLFFLFLAFQRRVKRSGKFSLPLLVLPALGFKHCHIWALSQILWQIVPDLSSIKVYAIPFWVFMCLYANKVQRSFGTAVHVG